MGSAFCRKPSLRQERGPPTASVCAAGDRELFRATSVKPARHSLARHVVIPIIAICFALTSGLTTRGETQVSTSSRSVLQTLAVVTARVVLMLVGQDDRLQSHNGL